MSVATRLARLEQCIGTDPPDRCPVCGADWIGSVVLCVEPDGRRRPACFRCLADRPDGRPVKTLAKWMIEALQ